MTEKLTLVDCFKYNKARIVENDFYKTGQSKEYGNIMDLINKHKEYYSFDKLLRNCKLILRLIEDLTDEEIKKCYDICLWNYDGVDRIERMFTINKPERFDCILSKPDRDLADYLRSINIDIDGMIDNGKAVKE